MLLSLVWNIFQKQESPLSKRAFFDLNSGSANGYPKNSIYY